MPTPHTAFVAIVGCPNVGKSSLMNRLLGQKLAIVSPKPQTTRTRILGLRTQDSLQWVFCDTPGLHRPLNRLGEHMNRAVHDSLDGVDLTLLVAEAGAHALRPQELELLRCCQNTPVVLVLNKLDALPRKEQLAAQIACWQTATHEHPLQAVVPLSAKTGANLDCLEAELLTQLVKLPLAEGFYFEADSLTDQPERSLAAELLREQLLRQLNQEVPHGIAVVVEKWNERPNGLLDLHMAVLCERPTHKGMIIGKGGAKLKQIATAARQSLERFFACQVNLQIWVKVQENWRDRDALFAELL